MNMRYCDECKSEELNLGCLYCTPEKSIYIQAYNTQLKYENEFLKKELRILKNELELIDEQHNE